MTADKKDRQPEQEGAGAVGSLQPGKSRRSTKVERLAFARANYAKDLPVRLSELKDFLHRLQLDPLAEDMAENAKIISHKIAGTAASYGFAEVGLYAKEIEDFIWELSDGVSMGEAEWKEVFMSLARALQSSTLPPAEALEGEVVSLPPGRELCLLAVDDEQEFLAHLMLLARQLMVRIVPALSAGEAVALAGEHDLDGALIDFFLTEDESDSIKLVRALREIPGRETLPIAFVSARSGLKERVTAAYSGASLFLDKPINAESFSCLIEHMSDLRQRSKSHVLIIDTDSQHSNQAASALRSRGIEVEILQSGFETVDFLNRFRPDLLVMNLLMPGFNGFEITRLLRSMPEWQSLPIVAIAPGNSWQMRVAAYSAGIDDCLDTTVNDEEFKAKIDSVLRRTRLLRGQARRDPVTGFLTRKVFMEELQMLLERAEDEVDSVVLAMLDIDDLKKINAQEGSLCGDVVLGALSRILRQVFKPEDLRGRWLSDELVIAVSHEQASSVVGVLEKVLRDFSGTHFPAQSGPGISLSFSAGISTYPEQARSAIHLIELAEKGLLQAKLTGPGTICFSSTELVGNSH